MKILNTTYRESEAGETIVKTPVSALQLTSEMFPESYIHIVQYIDDEKYESMKMTIETFRSKIYESIQNTFSTGYWDTHCLESSELHDKVEDLPLGLETASFAKMVEYLGEDAPTPVVPTDPNGFVDHVFYDMDVIKRYIVKKDNYLHNGILRLNDNLIALDCYFDQFMKFSTTEKRNDVVEYSHVSVNHKKSENDTYCQMQIQPGNKISNTWVAQATGNLVVYGWLDSTAALNNKAIPSAFCVLEAKINPIDEVYNTELEEEILFASYDSSDTPETPWDAYDTEDTWEIISVQPVNPFKSITYVGFNVPVHEGLMLRVRTGFTVGAKSGQYSNENDGYDTLSNSVANGFKCMIYSNSKFNPSAERQKA